MKQNVLRIISLTLCASLVVCFSGCGSKKDEGTTDNNTTEKVQTVEYDKAAQSVTKNETVYVNLDSSGKVTGINVTDWLHTSESEVAVFDTSNLSGIENLKSDISPVKKDSGFVWNMDSTDLYYGGKSESKPPVSFELKYYFDGKEVSASELAGKSGKVKIEINAINNCFEEREVGGKKIKVYLPVIVAGGMILDETVFSNVSVENGITVGDATKEIAAVFGAPGLMESLDISAEQLNELAGLELSNTATVTADAKDFKLGNMYFAVLPLCSMGIDFVDFNSVDDLKENLSRVKSILNQMETLDFSEIMNLLFSDGNKISELSSMITDAISLYESNKALIKVMGEYLTPENLDTLNNLLKDMDSAEIQSAIELLSNPVLQTFITDLPKLTKDLEAVSPLLDSLDEALEDEEVQKALDNLPDTIEKLSALQKQLDDNSELINTLTQLVSAENLETLEDLVSAIEESGLTENPEKYDELLENADVVIERARAWYAFGDSYRIFTSAPESMDTSLAFIYKTAGIK